MLIHELRMPVPTKKNTKIVEPCDDALQLHAIDQENCQRDLLFANMIEEGVLEALYPF